MFKSLFDIAINKTTSMTSKRCLEIFEYHFNNNKSFVFVIKDGKLHAKEIILNAALKQL